MRIIIFLILFIFTLISCNNVDKRISVISDNVQSIGSIKIKLDFEPILIKEIVKIKVKDSLQLCDSIVRIPVYPNKVNKESVNNLIKVCNNNITVYTKNNDVENIMLWTYIKSRSIDYLKYINMNDSTILSNVVYCKFSIINPYIKDERIIMERLFFFSPDNQTIFKSNNIK